MSRNTVDSDTITSAKAKELFGDQLMHDDTRQRVRAIVDDYVGSVDFMKRVREYAAMEIDAKLFTSVKFYATAVVTAIISTFIGIAVVKLLELLATA